MQPLECIRPLLSQIHEYGHAHQQKVIYSYWWRVYSKACSNAEIVPLNMSSCPLSTDCCFVAAGPFITAIHILSPVGVGCHRRVESVHYSIVINRVVVIDEKIMCNAWHPVEVISTCALNLVRRLLTLCVSDERVLYVQCFAGYVVKWQCGPFGIKAYKSKLMWPLLQSVWTWHKYIDWLISPCWVINMGYDSHWLINVNMLMTLLIK